MGLICNKVGQCSKWGTLVAVEKHSRLGTCFFFMKGEMRTNKKKRTDKIAFISIYVWHPGKTFIYTSENDRF